MVKIGSFSLLRSYICTLMLLAILFGSNQARSEVTVTATVDQNEIGLGDTLTLTISIASDETLVVGDQRLPELEGFDLLNQFSGRESRSVFSNGKFQFLQTQKFNYILQANREGKIVIPPVEVVANNKAYKTNAITITVSGPGSGANPRPQRPRRPPGFGEEEDPFESFQEETDELFNQLLQRRGLQPGQRGQPTNPDDAFSIQLEVDKKEAYVGEQVTATWWLYTRNQIQNIDTLKYPNLKGFWKEDIELATRLNFQQEVVNGIPYRRALLVSYALFPIKEGTTLIDSYKARCTVLMGGLGAFGFGNAYTFTKASPEVKIRIKPLPTHGRPADFSGGVGDFAVNVGLDSKTVPAHQPFSYRIRFEGKGNAKTVELPPLQLPAGLELYDTKSETKFNRDGTSYKQFELLLIPRQEGKLVIPPISVSIFDTKSEQYVQKTAPEIELSVVTGRVDPNLAKGNTSNPSEPVAPKLTSPELILEWEDTAPLSATTQFALWGIFFSLILGSLGYKAYRELFSSDKKRNLMERASRRLREARKQVISAQGNEWRKVGAEVTNIIYMVLGELAGEGGANTELEKLWPKLPPSIKQELGSELQTLLRDFEVIGFAPENVIGKLKEPSEIQKRLDAVEKLLLRAVALGNPEEVQAASART